MAKHLTLTVERTKWRATGAKLYLDDQGVNFNTPSIVVSLEGDQGERHVRFKFQRESLEWSRRHGQSRPALGIFDTAKRWSQCYGAEVELDDRATRVYVVDRPFALDERSQLCVALARKVARHIQERNTAYVYPCEAERVYRALEQLGAHPHWVYTRHDSFNSVTTVLDMHEARKAGIALRANDAARVDGTDREDDGQVPEAAAP